MASQETTSPDLATTLSFGAWLRQVRDQKALPQRAVAAAAQMDSSHYGKVEAGRRFFTDPQVAAVAECLGLTEAEVRRRMIAAQWALSCQGDASLLSEVAGLVQDAAAPYIVNKPANKVRTRK